MYKPSTIVYLHEKLYTDTTDNNLLIYKPNSQTGISVLNPASTYIFNCIDGKRTVGDIHKLAQKIDKRVTYANIEKIIHDLIISEVAYVTKDYIKFLAPQNRTLNVWFHITNQCNLRCTYCFIHKTSQNMTDTIGKASIDKLLVDAKKNKFTSVKITFAGGEPLLEFKKMKELILYGIEQAKRIGIQIEYGIVTNGILVTNEIAQFLKEFNMSCGVSLDGLGKFNDAQRVFANGLGTYKYVEKGMQILKSNKIRFVIQITITKKNIKHLPQLTQYCLDNQIRFIFNLYKKNPCGTSQSDLIPEDSELIKYLRESYQLIYNSIPTAKDIGYYYGMVNGILDRVKITESRTRACGIGNSYITISHYGLIYSCPMSMKEKPIGSIKNKDIIQTMIRKTFLYKQQPIINSVPKCITCKWKNVCAGGCPIAFTRSNATTPPHCDTYMSLIPDLLKIEGRFLSYFKMQGNASPQ